MKTLHRLLQASPIPQVRVQLYTFNVLVEATGSDVVVVFVFRCTRLATCRRWTSLFLVKSELVSLKEVSSITTLASSTFKRCHQYILKFTIKMPHVLNIDWLFLFALQ